MQTAFSPSSAIKRYTTTGEVHRGVPLPFYPSISRVEAEVRHAHLCCAQSGEAQFTNGPGRAQFTGRPDSSGFKAMPQQVKNTYGPRPNECCMVCTHIVP